MRRSIIAFSAAAVTAYASEYGAEGEFTGSTGAAPPSKKSAPSASKSAGNPHLTTESALGFVGDSVWLARDLSVFLGSSVGSLVWDNVPPKVQEQIYGKYEEVEKMVQTFRLKNGIPSCDKLKNEVKTVYEQKVAPHFTVVYNMADKVASPVMKLVTPLVEKFEKAYPEQAGKIPAHVLDLSLLIFFLMYFVVSTFMNLFCTVLCCGFCKSRKAKQPELKKKQPVPAGKKKQ